MAIRYELGDPDRPRGHALLYFRTTGGDVLVTYVVVFPIAMNPAKYIPPAFAAGLQREMTLSATALPPIPEEMANFEEVKRLATRRGDDLLDGGVVQPEPDRLMMATHEIANDYATAYNRAIESSVPEPEPEPAAREELDEDALRWVLMSEKERIGEIAKLTGQLRYAMDGGDSHLLRSTTEKIERLGRQLPEKYRISEFLAGAQRPGDAGRRLAELYIDRCYKLSNEQYETLADIDQEIATLESQ
jgi:hypothetical protein